MGRYVRLVERGWRATDALEAVRAEMADPVSDCVLLTFELAAEEGTAVVLRVLRGLLDQITADLALTERIETLQTQERIASKALLVVPYLMLLLLCTTTATFRTFYQSGAGLAVVAVGVSGSIIGFFLARRLGRPIPTTSRVFVTRERQTPRPVRGSAPVNAAIVVAALCAALAVGTASWQALRPLRGPARRLAPYTEVTRTRMGVPVESTPQPVMVAEAARRLLGPLAASLVSSAGRMLRVADTAGLEQRLRQAGSPMTVDDYRRRHLRWSLATPILGAVLGALLGSTVLAVVLFVAGAAGGGRRMGDQLRRLTRARAAQLRSDLPTVAGILSSRVENSNSLAVAVHAVVAMGSGPVIDDLGRAMVLKETGYSLADAFEMIAAEAIDAVRGQVLPVLGHRLGRRAGPAHHLVGPGPGAARTAPGGNRTRRGPPPDLHGPAQRRADAAGPVVVPGRPHTAPAVRVVNRCHLPAPQTTPTQKGTPPMTHHDPHTPPVGRPPRRRRRWRR